MKKMKSPLSKTNGTTDSRTRRGGRTKGHLHAAIVSTPELETTQTGTANTVFTVKYRTIPKKNAGKESKKISCVKTDKDVPTGQKCM